MTYFGICLLLLNHITVFYTEKVLELEKQKIDECCEIGVKGSCTTCDFSSFCNGKWNHSS